MVRASGYVAGLLRAAGSGVEFDYQPMEGAGEALAAMELIVAGYLVEIAPGVVWADTREREPMTQAQIEATLRFIDEREERLRSLGRLGPDNIATLERERRSALENAVPEPNDRVHVAYRIRVTEVLWGDFEVGGVLDVQVPLSVFTTLEEQQAALVGTPRAVVGGGWSSTVSRSIYQLQSADRAPLDAEVFYPWIELFWLDESVWDVGDLEPEGEPGPVGSTGALDDDGQQLPGGLLEDDTPSVPAVESEESLTERPAGQPEALYLDGLHQLHRAWGNVGTLDDLVESIRSAVADAATTAPETTTTTTAPDTTTTTTALETATTTTAPGTATTTTTLETATTTTVPDTATTAPASDGTATTTTAPVEEG